jgi:hypothetical protein
MLELLMDMLTPRSKRRAKRGGKAVKFEAEEKQTHIDMLAVLIAQSKEAQKSQGQRQQRGQEEQLGVQRKSNADIELYDEDVVFSNLAKECNIESFNSLDGVTPVMEDC